MKFKKWFFHNAGLRTKLVLSYSFLVCLPIVLIGFFSFYLSYQAAEKQIVSNMSNNIKIMSNELASQLEGEMKNVNFLAYNKEFRNDIVEYRNNPVELARILTQKIEPTFSYYLASDQNIKEIVVSSPYFSRAIGNYFVPMEDLNESAIESNAKVIWDTVEQQLYIDRKILDAASSTRVIGHIRFNLFPSFFSYALANDNIEMGSLVLTDAAGNLVYQQSTESIAESIIEDVQFGKSQEVVQEGYFVKKIAVENTDWQLAYLVSKQEVTGILWPIIQQTILVLIICLMLSIILISYLSKQITSRLYQLSADSDSVANGALNSIEFTEDQDEIGIVTNSIAKMQQSQHELTEKLVTSEIERSDVEKKSLQSMIHPHFLYNTLSSMKWKAIYHDETEIAQGLSWLATFYRTSLNSGHFFTTVENELENVHAYIDLQQVMHEQKFTVNESVEEETLACRMPNFLLQPLIENGIQHGFAMNDMKGLASILNIRIYLSEDQLIIEIENNGATFDREKLARALEHKGNGYGLYNLRRRLELAYGERGHIYFEEIAADFTRIRIVIPKESNES